MAEIAAALADTPVRTVRDWAKAGEFGPLVAKVGHELMVPQSGWDAFLAARRIDLSEAGKASRRALMAQRLKRPVPAAVVRFPSAGVTARSVGELRRKCVVRTSGREDKAYG